MNERILCRVFNNCVLKHVQRTHCRILQFKRDNSVRCMVSSAQARRHCIDIFCIKLCRANGKRRIKIENERTCWNGWRVMKNWECHGGVHVCIYNTLKFKEEESEGDDIVEGDRLYYGVGWLPFRLVLQGLGWETSTLEIKYLKVDVVRGWRIWSKQKSGSYVDGTVMSISRLNA